MDHNEHLYRRAGVGLIVLIGLWVGAMLLALVLPAKLWKTGLPSLILFEGIVPVLFVAIIALSVLRMFAYIRWTGKYPYYWLFQKSHRPSDSGGKRDNGST
jgi:hypothetical protein